MAWRHPIVKSARGLNQSHLKYIIDKAIINMVVYLASMVVAVASMVGEGVVSMMVAGGEETSKYCFISLAARRPVDHAPAVVPYKDPAVASPANMIRPTG